MTSPRRVLHFGIREHAMGNILNAINTGLTRAYGGTFLVFADYMRGAVRLAALQKIPTIFVWTHDSIGVGEDGPTHQPIEHVESLRIMPGIDVIRPADANETAQAWALALSHTDRPSALILSRQDLPIFDRAADGMAPATEVAKGAYTLIEADGELKVVIIIATGSEVSVAVEARAALQAEGIGTRVVSAPCLEWFDAQPADYRAAVLPDGVAKVAVELRACPPAGVVTWGRRARSSASITSVNRRPATSCSPSTASPPTTSRPRPSSRCLGSAEVACHVERTADARQPAVAVCLGNLGVRVRCSTDRRTVRRAVHLQFGPLRAGALVVIAIIAWRGRTAKRQVPAAHRRKAWRDVLGPASPLACS